MKKISLATFILMLTAWTANAQEEVQMADKFRAEGKIYIVILVMLIIFIGLSIYLFSIDKRVKALEKRTP